MKLTLLSSALALAALLAAGCGGEGDGYGAPLSDAAVTPVADILTDPSSFEGRSVKIEGEIVRECPSGCWFELGEGRAVIYVDIAPSGLAIPQRVGDAATVEGVVALRDGRPMVLGSGVVIR